MNRDGRVRLAVDVVRAEQRVVEMAGVVALLPERDRDRVMDAREDGGRLRDRHGILPAKEVNSLPVHTLDEIAAAQDLAVRHGPCDRWRCRRIRTRGSGPSACATSQVRVGSRSQSPAIRSRSR